MNRTLILLACMFPACVPAWGQESEYESFEDGLPKWVTASRAESLSISPRHAKQGKTSLRWDWRRGEELVIRHGIGDLSRKGGLGGNNRPSFAIWVYLEQPVADALVFQFREGEKATGSFRFPLEFAGWRQGRPLYHAFPSGKPTAKVDNIRVAAPTTAAQGTVFLDLIKYNTLTYPGRAVLPEKEAQWRRPGPDDRRHPKPERVTEAELEGIRKLLGPDEGPGIAEARVKSLCGQVKALGIVRDEHGVRGGPGIDRHYQYCCEFAEHGSKSQSYWPDEHGPGWLDMQNPSRVTSLAYQVAAAYRASNDADQRRRLADAFLLLEEHLFDQGMQAAAGFHWNWWVGGAWGDAVFLMRDVLAKAGHLTRQCDYLLWNWGGGELFAEGDPTSHSDYYLLTVPRLLRTCLVQPEAAEQVRWLRAFQAMLERSILQPTSALKIDGCAYHHGGHYFGYTAHSMPALAETFQRFSETPWRLRAEAHERLRRAALAQRIFCNQRDLPLALSGRVPFSTTILIPEGLDRLARSGTPDASQAIDPESAAAYLRLAPEAAKKEPYCNLKIAPESDPSGCFVMPYAALVSHRRHNWLASVHGQSKYVWGTERQSLQNCFGLFQGLGHFEILAGGNPVTAKASGRDAAGWDWRRFEGTTVPQIPLDQIKTGWTSPYSRETFVGGLSHRSQGMFAMIVNQPLPGKKTLKARKSWFFSDARIFCLGSDISCDEPESPTQTTLCQKRLAKDQKSEFPATRLDGADLAGFPEERRLDDKTPHWFLDVQQTGYCLPAAQKVTVARIHQKSRQYCDQGDTEGDFLTAWLDHGKAPNAASYEYTVVVQATPETMQKLASQPAFRVLQRDQAAHIVWDCVGRRSCCAFFVPQEVAFHAAAEPLPIKTVDRPCLAMAEPVQNGILELAVADPDLNLQTMPGHRGPASYASRPLKVTLHGAWRLLDVAGTVCAWRLPDAADTVRVLSATATGTFLEINCQHGASYHLKLARQ